MELIIIGIYCVTLLTQLGAIYFATSAFRYHHKYQAGWLVLAFALCLMLGRQIMSVITVYETEVFYLNDALWALPISVFLLIGVITVRKVVFELNESKAKLSQLLQTDTLTGAYSRTEIFRRCEAEIERSKRTGHPLAILELDIDHFKNVNDQYGHGIGDEVLLGLTQSCLQSIRKMDSYGRIGGEEFIILLPETNLQLAQEVAERLRKNVELCAHQTTIGKNINITISIGIALFDPSSDLENMSNLSLLKALTKKADRAMYQAKQSGRNRVVSWN